MFVIGWTAYVAQTFRRVEEITVNQVVMTFEP